jgi:hypothetical protein
MTSRVISIADYKKRKETVGFKGIGLCAIFSRQGDWAFDYALSLARRHKAKLNIFHFLESPYSLRRDVVFVDANRTETARVTPDLLARKDQEMREMFDDKLGDYLNVGFRLCEGNDEFELRKCFRKGDYDVLIVGYKGIGAAFGGTTTIEKFAVRFKGPVVLVGPDAADSFYLNEPAVRGLSDLRLPYGKWKRIEADTSAEH